MFNLTSTDAQVERRVLECFRSYTRKSPPDFSYNHKSLAEITKLYNQLYPPSKVDTMIGIKIGERKILMTLKSLIAQNLVRKELLSFTDRPLRVPENFYCLTAEGLSRLSAKR